MYRVIAALACSAFAASLASANALGEGEGWVSNVHQPTVGTFSASGTDAPSPRLAARFTTDDGSYLMTGVLAFLVNEAGSPEPTYQAELWSDNIGLPGERLSTFGNTPSLPSDPGASAILSFTVDSEGPVLLKVKTSFWLVIQCTNSAELSWGRTLWSSQYSPGEWTIDQFVAEQASGSDPWQNITSQHRGDVPKFAVLAESLGDPEPPSFDLTGDRIVDGADLGALLGQWGGAGTADFNDSGTVDAADLGLLVAAWTAS